MKLTDFIDQLVEAFRAGTAERLAALEADPTGEYDRLHKLRHINKDDLP